uniref:Helix-turn-helix domain protein n=1 Tax=Cystobacter fuscus TaxID=43 RepID=A0A3S7UX19_9BACT|nr:helix-turn-helix domain protein [Cystobacter fuscus]
MRSTMDREGMANALRTWRLRVSPEELGLERGRRRRTPGLRREEVAARAGMSVDYYARLEQGRGPRPSAEVLEALASALRLSDDERTHLHHLAGPHERPRPIPKEVRPGIQQLLAQTPTIPVLVHDVTYDVLAWNEMAAALLVDFAAWEPPERNLLWLALCDPRGRQALGGPSSALFVDQALSDLRATAARRAGDPVIARLVERLSASSETFARRWSGTEAAPRRTANKSFVHPVAGPLELLCEVLEVPEREQRVVFYLPVPGTPTEQRLRTLTRQHEKP